MSKILIVILFLNAVAFSAPITVKCSGVSDGKKHTALFKMENGKIIQWDADHYAKTSSKGLFAAFGESISTYGFEWEKSFKAPNGYSILELGTTADSFQIGINLNESKGFYSYKDLGSGAGNSKLSLTCNEQN